MISLLAHVLLSLDNPGMQCWDLKLLGNSNLNQERRQRWVFDKKKSVVSLPPPDTHMVTSLPIRRVTLFD